MENERSGKNGGATGVSRGELFSESESVERREAELRAIDERYRAFIENSTEGIWRFELEEPIPTDLPADEQVRLAYKYGYLAECNDAMARQYGFASASDLTGARISDLLVEDDPNNYAFVKAFIESGYKLTDAESHERDAEGRERYFLNNFVGVVENGRVLRAWGTQRDITEQKIAEERLRESENQMRLVTDAMPALISYIDSEYRYGYINRAYTEWFGVKSSETIGRSMAEVLGDEAFETLRPHVEAALSGRTEIFETEIPYKDGGRRFVHATYTPDRGDDGSVKGFFVLVLDITKQKQTELELRESQMLQSMAMDSSRMGAWEYDLATGTVNWSAELEKIFGLEQGAFPGTHAAYSAFIHEEDRDQVRAAVEAAIKERRDYSIEFRFTRPDGTTGWMEGRGRAVYSQSGEPVRLYGTGLDITERKAAEAALDESEERFTRFMQNLPGLAWIKDTDGRYVFANDAAEEAFRVPRAELYGKTDEEIFPPEIAAKFAENDRRALEGGLRDLVVETLEHDDGAVHHSIVSKFPIPGRDGEPKLIGGVAIDITEQKRTEERLRESEERYRALTELSPQFVFTARPDGFVTYVNRYTQEFTGRKFDELIGEGWPECIQPEHRDEAFRTWISAVEYFGEYEDEVPFLYKDGTYRWIYARARPTRDENGDVLYWFGTAIDITDRKLAEEAVRRSQRQLALVTDTAPVFIANCDREERFKFVNRAYAERLGLHPRDCIGKRISDIVGNEGYAVLRPYIKTVLSGKAVEFEAEVSYPTIGMRFVHCSYVPELDRVGEVVGCVAAVTDITERRRSEEKLREANERFRIAEQASRGFVYDWNLRTDEFTRSEGFTTVLGYAPGEVASSGEAWRKLIHPSDLESLVTRVDEMLAHGEERIEVEYRVRHKNGSWIWVLDESAVVLDARRSAARLVGSAVDITARKQAEGRLALLAEISETARTTTDPADLLYKVSCAVGEHLQAQRCLFNEIDIEKDRETVHRDYCDGVPSVAGVHKVSEYSTVTTAEMTAGKTVVNNDSKTDPRTAAAYKRVYEPIRERAYVAVPLMREGRWVASLWVSHDKPRIWQRSEITLLENIAERVWSVVEKLRVNAALAESEERFSKAFNSSPLVFTLSSLHDGRLIEVNQTFVDVTGYSREEAIGKTSFELGLWINNNDREAEMAAVRDLGQVRDIEYTFRTRNGDEIIGLLSAERIEIGGEPFALTIIQDITDRKQTEQALIAAERRAADDYHQLLSRIIPLAQILGEARDVLSISRSVKDFVRGSMNCSAFFVSFYDEIEHLRLPGFAWGDGDEIDISELPPMPITMQGGPNSRAILGRKTVVTNALWDEMKNRPHVVVQENGIDPMSSLVVPMLTKDKVIGTLEVQSYEDNAFRQEHVIVLEMVANIAAVAIENVRLIGIEAKARQEAENANRTKDEFLSILSHELRTPLNSILGWVRMLRSGLLDSENVEKAMEVIERNTRLQSSLIEDLLDVSRIISGKMQIETQPLDLVATVKEAFESLRPLAENKNLAFEFSGGEKPFLLDGDKVRIQQLVTNLVQNAIKFTPEGGSVAVTVETENDLAKLIVEDTGIGIEKDFLPNLFDRFSQADASTKRAFSGLGLGLTIAHKIVELHGGAISVESEGRNTGSVFTATFPISDAFSSDAQHTADKLLDSGNTPSLAGVSILLVDDDTESLVPIDLFLKQHDAETEIAASGRDALEILAKRNFNLMISDIGMPSMDGYDLLAILRKTPRNGEPQMPAIALTAYASEYDRRKVVSAGFREHLAKPVDFDELLSTISKVLNVSN